jgi:hypothetical protein
VKYYLALILMSPQMRSRFFGEPLAAPDGFSLSGGDISESSNFVFKINLIGVALVFFLSVVAYSEYPGGLLAFFLFSAASLAVAALPLFGRPSAFTLFLVAFLSLGFWLKLISFLLFGLVFIEPTGSFDFSPEAWDRTLLISASGLASVAAAGGLCKLIDPHGKKLHLDQRQSPLFAKIAWPLFLSSIAIAILIFFVNYRYSILKVGVVPLVYFGMLPNVTIGFMVSWGTMMWLGGLTFWMIIARQLPVSALFYVAAVEGAIASTSMSSRVQMIVHVAAAAGAYWTCAGRFRWRLGKISWLCIAATTGLLFAASIAAVSVGRVTAYTDATLVVPRTDVAFGTRAAAPKGVAMLNRVVDELKTLFIGRWIGLEGAMVVSSANGLGWNLFRDGLFEGGEAGVDSIYQRMSDAKYPHYSNYVFQTLPGPIAVMFYSGSYAVVAAGMALIFIVCYTLEGLVERVSRNPAVSCLVGVALAYLFVQMNYPRTFIIFGVEVVTALAISAAVWILLIRVYSSVTRSRHV